MSSKTPFHWETHVSLPLLLVLKQQAVKGLLTLRKCIVQMAGMSLEVGPSPVQTPVPALHGIQWNHAPTRDLQKLK